MRFKIMKNNNKQICCAKYFSDDDTKKYDFVAVKVTNNNITLNDTFTIYSFDDDCKDFNDDNCNDFIRWVDYTCKAIFVDNNGTAYIIGARGSNPVFEKKE